MNNLYKIEIVGKNKDNTNIYGCVYKDKKYKYIEMPESWGTKQHAIKYMVTQKLFMTWAEWQALNKTEKQKYK